MLGLAYSSRETLALAINEKRGIYKSRTRGVWIKSPSRVDGQILVSVDVDCDRDALVFTIKQYGNFCHNNTLSCFTPLLTVVERQTLRLGFTYGNSLNKVMAFFRSIGIHVTQSCGTRDTHYTATSDLYDQIQLIPVKPRDVSTFINRGILDAVVCFSDCLDDAVGIRSVYPETNVDTVQVVAVCHESKWDLDDTPKSMTIFSEYPKEAVKLKAKLHNRVQDLQVDIVVQRLA